jgi:preprotein translocase subunit SecB
VADGSVKSGFQFDSYKVDKIDFTVEQNLSTLASRQNDFDVKYSFSFRDALKYKDSADKVLYVTGLRVYVSVLSKNDQHEMAKGMFEITGLFVSMGTFTPEQEEFLARTQAPTILFPYVRAIISQTMYNAGFAIPIMPLLNINEMAKDTKLKIIDK